jgi:flagellin
MIAGQSLAAEQRAIEKQVESLERELARLGAVDGAYSVVADLLIELNGLVVQAANRAGMTEGELEALQTEADSILQTLDHLAATSVHAGERILSAAPPRTPA